MKRSRRIPVDLKEKHHFVVYILYSNDVIVYVGKTVRSTEIRIGYHANTEKIFDSYEIIECDSKQEMNEQEAELIFIHIPKYNRELPILPSQNFIYIGQIKGYKEVNKKLEEEGIILKGKVYIKIANDFN